MELHTCLLFQPLNDELLKIEPTRLTKNSQPVWFFTVTLYFLRIGRNNFFYDSPRTNAGSADRETQLAKAKPTSKVRPSGLNLGSRSAASVAAWVRLPEVRSIKSAPPARRGQAPQRNGSTGPWVGRAAPGPRSRFCLTG